MAAHVRMRILLAVAVAVICGGVFAVTDAQRRADERSFAAYDSVNGLRSATMRLSLNLFMAADRGRAAEPDVRAAQAEVEKLLAQAGDGPLYQQQTAAVRELSQLAEAAMDDRSPQIKQRHGEVFNRFRVANDALQAQFREQRLATQRASARRPVLLLAGLCLIFGLLHLVLVEKPAYQERRRRALQLQQAERDAATDGLTGLANKRTAHATLARAAAQAGRTISPLSLVLFDLDHFKSINDTYGHATGDAVLAAVGRVAADTVRASDFAGRFGGEEFLLILPDTGRQGALELAEKLRVAISAITIDGLDRTITASFGVAVLPDDAGAPDELLAAADRALYAAKHAGRDRVMVAA